MYFVVVVIVVLISCIFKIIFPHVLIVMTLAIACLNK